MRKLIAVLGPFTLLASGLVFAAAEKKAPEKLVFNSKQGDVTYLHQKHSERVKEDCKVCHPKLWPQDAKAPLNFKAGVHKVAEKNETSCGACHRPKGTAFATAGNCAKCHVKGKAAAD